MKSNEELQADVQDAIRWEPLLHIAEIGVTAKDGIVTLTGVVDSYSKKMEAEDATKKVLGVKALVEKIEVEFPMNWAKTSEDIAVEVLASLQANCSVPNHKIIVKVEDAWVTLEGELEWNYQKEAAKRAISYLDGVKGVTNNIEIKCLANEVIEKKNIENAIARNWSLDDSDIKVTVSGNTVTLKGMVNSWYHKDEAGRIAWNSPGAGLVNNEIVIGPYFTKVE